MSTPRAQSPCHGSHTASTVDFQCQILEALTCINRRLDLLDAKVLDKQAIANIVANKVDESFVEIIGLVEARCDQSHMEAVVSSSDKVKVSEACPERHALPFHRKLAMFGGTGGSGQVSSCSGVSGITSDEFDPDYKTAASVAGSGLGTFSACEPDPDIPTDDITYNATISACEIDRHRDSGVASMRVDITYNAIISACEIDGHRDSVVASMRVDPSGDVRQEVDPPVSVPHSSSDGGNAVVGGNADVYDGAISPSACGAGQRGADANGCDSCLCRIGDQDCDVDEMRVVTSCDTARACEKSGDNLATFELNSGGGECNETGDVRQEIDPPVSVPHSSSDGGKAIVGGNAGVYDCAISPSAGGAGQRVADASGCDSFLCRISDQDCNVDEMRVVTSSDTTRACEKGGDNLAAFELNSGGGDCNDANGTPRSASRKKKKGKQSNAAKCPGTARVAAETAELGSEASGEVPPISARVVLAHEDPCKIASSVIGNAAEYATAAPQLLDSVANPLAVREAWRIQFQRLASCDTAVQGVQAVITAVGSKATHFVATTPTQDEAICNVMSFLLAVPGGPAITATTESGNSLQYSCAMRIVTDECYAQLRQLAN